MRSTPAPRKITVEIQAGGRSLIRVTDDGFGMSRDDALLCLERHATSKIQRAEDLAAIATMGFRGEALPSIASVSRFTLTTRERESDSPEGTQIIVNGGKIAEVKAAGSAPGTSVEVRQLFFNLPARRKFLRTEETEAAHIQHYLTLAALAFPEVAFTFRQGWPQRLATARRQNPARPLPAASKPCANGFRALLGDEKLLPVNFSAALDETESSAPEETDIFETASPEKPEIRNPKSEIRIWGLIGAPGVSRATRDGQFVFVNRRPVENRGLNYALIEGYHTSLMKGRYPVCCLFLEIDPAAVDVNIHPAKREVKFHREFEVRKLVAQAVQETLLAFHAEPEAEVQSQQGAKARKPIKPAAGTSSAPALPNFPEKLKPSPATAAANSTGAATAFENGLFAAGQTPQRPTATAAAILQPPALAQPRIRNLRSPAPRSNRDGAAFDRRHAAAQRPAPARRRHRQTLCPAGIRPRTGVAGPARGARADFVRADAEPHGAERRRAVAKTAAAGDH